MLNNFFKALPIIGYPNPFIISNTFFRLESKFKFVEYFFKAIFQLQTTRVGLLYRKKKFDSSQNLTLVRTLVF